MSASSMWWVERMMVLPEILKTISAFILIRKQCQYLLWYIVCMVGYILCKLNEMLKSTH